MADEKDESFGMWAICELMGHVRMAGWLTEVNLFGTALGRIDIPVGEAPSQDSLPGMEQQPITQFFGGQSVYRITPCDEETARQVARSARPAPIHRLSLSAPRPDFDDFDDDRLAYR